MGWLKISANCSGAMAEGTKLVRLSQLTGRPKHKEMHWCKLIFLLGAFPVGGVLAL